MALKAIPEPVSLVELRRRCQAMMPRVDIGELILEVMGWHPQFSAAYTHVSGGARIRACDEDAYRILNTPGQAASGVDDQARRVLGRAGRGQRPDVSLSCLP